MESVNHRVESYRHDTESSPFRFMMPYQVGAALQRNGSSACLGSSIQAHYCSALETLFTTESTEITHKLAERVSFFLGKDGSERIKIFHTVKAAYSIRSKLVHGGGLRGNQIDNLPLLSKTCDSRQVLTAIFDSKQLQEVFDSRQDGIETCFLDLIFHGKNRGTTAA